MTLVQLIFFIVFTLVLAGCSTNNEQIKKHYGADFKLSNEKIVSQNILDKQYRQYHRTRTPLRIKGLIKHQCQELGAWAFIENEGVLVLINFEAATPNLRLPPKQIGKKIILEGTVTPDGSVLNGYQFIPYAFEFID